MTATELHHRIRLLQLERLEAHEIGLLAHAQYRRDLENELAECRAAFVGAAVTEIAVLRADLSGRLLG